MGILFWLNTSTPVLFCCNRGPLLITLQIHTPCIDDIPHFIHSWAMYISFARPIAFLPTLESPFGTVFAKIFAFLLMALHGISTNIYSSLFMPSIFYQSYFSNLSVLTSRQGLSSPILNASDKPTAQAPFSTSTMTHFTTLPSISPPP